MTEINLLPWREYKREQQKKLFTIMILAGIGLSLILVYLMNTYAVHKRDNQQTRNELLHKEILTLNKEINDLKRLKQTKTQMINRMSTLQNLQMRRTLSVHLFDELIKVMPNGAYASKLQRQGDVITLWGYADTSTSVSLLMKNIDDDLWIQFPVLGEIKNLDDKKQGNNNEFKLSFSLKPKPQIGNP